MLLEGLALVGKVVGEEQCEVKVVKDEGRWSHLSLEGSDPGEGVYLATEECWSSRAPIMSLLPVGAGKGLLEFAITQDISLHIFTWKLQPEKCVLCFRKLCCPMSCSYQGSRDPSQTPFKPMAYFCWTPFLQDPSLWGTFQDSAGDAEYIHFGKFLPKFLWGFLGSHSPNPANLHLPWTLLWARTCPMPLTPLPHLPQCLLACPMPLTPLPHLPQCPLACPMPLTPSPLLPHCPLALFSISFHFFLKKLKKNHFLKAIQLSYSILWVLSLPSPYLKTPILLFHGVPKVVLCPCHRDAFLGTFPERVALWKSECVSVPRH